MPTCLLNRRWWFAFTLFCLILVVEARESSHFDQNECRKETLILQAESNFTKNTAEFFLQDPITKQLYNGPDNMTLTFAGCEEFCGSWSFYWDAVPRITTWILPAVLLLSNIELSPIDKMRFMTIIHAIGDPIDSFWSLIHKVYIWNRLYKIGLNKSQRFDDDQGRFFAKMIAAVVAITDAAWHCLLVKCKIRKPRNDSDRNDSDTNVMTKDHRARIIATVLAGFEEISGAKIESEAYYYMITRQLGRLGEDNEDPVKFNLFWRLAARMLADARTNEFLRTCLAIFIYIFGLVAAFIPAVGGGNTSPPGGRIGAAIFLSWLVPLALLSNTIGAFTSRRTCLHIMTQFVWAVTHTTPNGAAPGNEVPAPGSGVQGSTSTDPTPNDNAVGHNALTVHVHPQANNVPAAGRNILRNTILTFCRNAQGNNTPVANDNGWTPLIDDYSWKHYFNSLQYLGSICTYRPWKVIYLDTKHRGHAHWKNVIMALGGVFPIAVGVGGAFVILWYADPKGFSCRHLWVLAIFGAWILSAFITSVLYYFLRNRLKRHTLWWIVVVKDLFIGLPSIALVFLSTVGAFNSCYCWSGKLTRGDSANIPLNIDGQYQENARKIYSLVVAGCILAQLAFFATIMLRWWNGVKLVRWAETRRRREWVDEMHHQCVNYGEENFLLFWYKREELEREEQEIRGIQGNKVPA